MITRVKQKSALNLFHIIQLRAFAWDIKIVHSSVREINEIEKAMERDTPAYKAKKVMEKKKQEKK